MCLADFVPRPIIRSLEDGAGTPRTLTKPRGSPPSHDPAYSPAFLEAFRCLTVLLLCAAKAITPYSPTQINPNTSPNERLFRKTPLSTGGAQTSAEDTATDSVDSIRRINNEFICTIAVDYMHNPAYFIFEV